MIRERVSDTEREEWFGFISPKTSAQDNVVSPVDAAIDSLRPPALTLSSRASDAGRADVLPCQATP